jgi:hypothetical protein
MVAQRPDADANDSHKPGMLAGAARTISTGSGESTRHEW